MTESTEDPQLDLDLEIEIENATENEKPTEEQPVIEKAEDPAPAPAPAPDSVDEGLRRLQEKLDAERKARVEAERIANEKAQEAYRFRSEAQDSSLHLVTNAIKALEQQNEVLKANYRDAMANQDYDTVADLQMEMSSNAAKLAQLESGRQALESAPKPEEPKLYVTDKVEALASQLTPRSAAWVRAHPEFAEDPVKYNKMLAAHNLVTADGIQPDTDDYFAAIEDVLRIAPRRQEAPQAEAPTQPQQRQASPPAAPVSRAGAAPGAKPTRVRLSAEEREMAEMMGMTPEDYGRHKLALIKDGRLH